MRRLATAAATDAVGPPRRRPAACEGHIPANPDR